MAVPSTITKYFSALKGLDLRSSDLLRPADAATAVLNADYRDTGALSKRRGYQFISRGDLGSSDIIANGLYVWRDVDESNGAIVERLVACGRDLFEYAEDTLTLTYTGSGAANYSIGLNPSTGNFEFILQEDGTTVSTQNLGTGVAADMTVSTLVTNLNGVTNFTCTGASSAANEKAAYILSRESAAVSSTGTEIAVPYWKKVDVPTGLSLPFSAHWAKRTDSSFENPCFAQLGGVLYVSNGYDSLSKFDGNRVYRAGLPKAQLGTITEDGCGSTFSTGNKYDYRAVYEYTDARGNLIAGELSDTLSYTVSGASVDLVVPAFNIKASGGTVSNIGFNIDQAVVNGAQSSTNTVTVDAGHDLKEDDYVYLLDTGSSEVVRRRVTSTTSTTIVLDGGAVSVGDNDIISCVKISVYRTTNYSSAGVPGLSYLVQELVNDNSADSQSFTDSVSDSSLEDNIQLIEPIKPHGLAPKAKYMIAWRDQLVLLGDIANTNVVYYSDIDSPEYFPDADNSFNIGTPGTGLYAKDNFLYVFEEEKINVVTGDFGTDNFTVSPASSERVGCLAHHSISEVTGSAFFLARDGIFSISGSGNLDNVGSPIDPRFGPSSPYDFKQAVGFNWAQNDKYLIFLPVNNQASGNALSAGDSSEIYAFDYSRGAWLQWDSFNFMGGIVEFKDNLHLLRRSTSASSTPDSQLARILNTASGLDYADHDEAISFRWSSAWEDLGEPSVWKKYLRIKVHSLDASLSSFEVGSFDLNITTQHNYDPTADIADITIDFSGGALGWGNSSWGEFPWGEARLKGAKNKLASKKVRSHRTTFKNAILHENILISGYELELVTPYRPAIKE